MKHIQKEKQTITEGELRCQQLSEYLEKLNLPKKVWLSEDASGIVPKVTYQKTTNELIGLVLPTDDRTGMPVSLSFCPHRAKDIEDMMRMNRLSTLVYIIVAQPVAIGAPPFILSLFGTDNTFKSKDVLFRWQHTINQLSR